jgi:ABC-type antimicrobial peptide transport system permease subunit
MAYFPLDATPAYYNTLEVRTTAEPRALADALRTALQELEPKLPVERVMAVTDLASNSLRQERLISRLTTLVSGLALGLACLGLYGLMSYGVKTRVSELGLRLALGASRSRVLWMIFRESLWLVAVGLALGLPIVAVASRLIGTMLFEVGPFDPATVATAMLVLLAVGASSGYLPAWRASRVDPMVALRQD